jgi:GNAT superfamily N-acetyltransferase
MKSIDNKNQSDDSNVTIKKGKIKNIKKYLSIFNECKHDGYISHGEVLCGRATHDLKWADNIMTQMKREFMYYISSRNCDILEIFFSGELTGFAIIEFNKKVKAAVLSDIMIKKDCQGKGIGKEALHNIEEYLRNKHISMLLLESGIKNESAHYFFEKNGYNKISVEFYKKLM